MVIAAPELKDNKNNHSLVCLIVSGSVSQDVSKMTKSDNMFRIVLKILAGLLRYVINSSDKFGNLVRKYFWRIILQMVGQILLPVIKYKPNNYFFSFQVRGLRLDFNTQEAYPTLVEALIEDTRNEKTCDTPNCLASRKALSSRSCGFPG